MMENVFLIERLGQVRFLEDLRRAGLDRLARQAEPDVRQESLLKRLLGRRMVSSATGAGEVPGL